LNNIFVDLRFTTSKQANVSALPNVKKLNKNPNALSDISSGDAFV
jgi:hypothetical protein